MKIEEIKVGMVFVQNEKPRGKGDRSKCRHVKIMAVSPIGPRIEMVTSDVGPDGPFNSKGTVSSYPIRFNVEKRSLGYSLVVKDE